MHLVFMSMRILYSSSLCWIDFQINPPLSYYCLGSPPPFLLGFSRCSDPFVLLYSVGSGLQVLLERVMQLFSISPEEVTLLLFFSTSGKKTPLVFPWIHLSVRRWLPYSTCFTFSALPLAPPPHSFFPVGPSILILFLRSRPSVLERWLPLNWFWSLGKLVRTSLYSRGTRRSSA